MKFQISQFREYSNTKNESFFNCKIFLGWYGGVWISELDYKEKPYLIEIINNPFKSKGNSNLELFLNKWSDENPERTINLVEPIDENYVIENKEGKNGAFKVLIPKLEKHTSINHDSHQSTKAKYESIDINQIIDKTKAQNVDDINQNGSMSLNELLGSTNPEWYSNNDRFNIESKTESDPVKIDTIITNDNIDIASSKDDTLTSSKEKFSFINNIIDLSVKKNVDDNTRKRLINLISAEVDKTEVVEKGLIKRVELIEAKLNGTVYPTEKKENKKKHSPKKMVVFLQKFSKDEQFKWFTHDPEIIITSFDYNEYINSADKEFKNITGWDINNLTFGNVRNFIFNTEYDCCLLENEIIKFTWKDVGKWCVKHPNTHPFMAEIDGEIFKKYIDQFKNIIEFRPENRWNTFDRQFRNLINKKGSVDLNITYINEDDFVEIGKSLSVYIDVRLFFTSLGQIFEWINSNKSKSNEVEISIFNRKELYELNIFHRNSYFSFEPTSDKLKGLNGDFNKIRKMLFSVVDWDVFASFKFENIAEDFKISCLNNDTELDNKSLSPTEITKIKEPINGIKHIFKIYKTINL